MQFDIEKGSVLLVNKPLTWTSFDVVNKLRYAVIRNLRHHHPELFEGKKYKPKVGHAGTLDPLATGLLIVCAGRETRNIETYMGLEKEYTGAIFLGATRPSFDRETEVDATYETAHITPDHIREAAATFIGETKQIPPVFSAVRKNGRRAYDSAREGKDIQLDARTVLISEFEISRIEMPLVHFRIVCSKGTYIRSVAADLGKALHSGAYLDSLCRTRIGTFHLKDALHIEDALKDLAIS